MRSLLIDHILPLSVVCGILVIVFVCWGLPETIAPWGTELPTQVQTEPSPNYIPALRSSREHEEMIKFALRSGTLIILGSSELAENSDAVSYRFIPATYHFPVLGVGHAGYQSLAILSTLGCMAGKLHHARLLMIISPGWFEDLSSGGTTVDLFLENLSGNMLRDMILTEELPVVFKYYIAAYIAEKYNTISRSSAPLRYLYHLGISEKNIFFSVIHYPFLKWNRWLLTHPFGLLVQKKQLENQIPELASQIVYSPEPARDVEFVNWDSLMTVSSALSYSRSTNNRWGISDDYYTTYIHGNTGRIKPVSPGQNQELQDFGMLVALLKTFNCRATFVIQPLNPFYFQTLPLLQPTIQAVVDTITTAGFPCLNLFETDSTFYNKAMLRDVMHMDDYAWYIVNQFIEDQYIKNE